MKKVFHMGFQKTLLQKFYELPMGAQGYTVEFTAANRQFDWLEMSLGFDKSDKHSMIYDSCTAEGAPTPAQSILI